MSEKLKDYQVLDVFCGGTLYKVSHKVTNNIFAWKAYNCFAFSDEQIQNIDNEVKILSKVLSGNFLRYYDTILHRPTKTLYFVLEYISWQSVQELISLCKATDKYFTENFIWYLLLELARTCKAVKELNFVTLKKCFSAESIFVGPNGEVRANCFEICLQDSKSTDLIRQIGEVIRSVCNCFGVGSDKIEDFKYSDDLRDMIAFLTDDRSYNLYAEVVLYHPTVLANTDISTGPKYFTDIFVSTKCPVLTSLSNKSDSEKVVEQCKAIQLLAGSQAATESSNYCNWKTEKDVEEYSFPQHSMSPTIAALALELPGFIPRNRKLYGDELQKNYDPQIVSEKIFSRQWITRLIALREREESLNRRERDLIAKEIMSSPSMDISSLYESREQISIRSNGITLPQVLNQVSEEKNNWASHHYLRSSVIQSQSRRKSHSYGDLDISLSGDSDGSSLINGTEKITCDYISHRNLSKMNAKKINFTSSNSFAESDESITLTFYNMENGDSKRYHTPKREEKVLKDITKFKYLDLEKVSSDRRSAYQWNHSQASKQVRITGKVLSDITNKSLRKSPVKISFKSKGIELQKQSMIGLKYQQSHVHKAENSQDNEHNSFDNKFTKVQTPKVPLELSKSKIKSILSFKTPFKFKTSTTV